MARDRRATEQIRSHNDSALFRICSKWAEFKFGLIGKRRFKGLSLLNVACKTLRATLKLKARNCWMKKFCWGYWRCLEKSGLWLEKVDRTHLVLASRKLLWQMKSIKEEIYLIPINDKRCKCLIIIFKKSFCLLRVASMPTQCWFFGSQGSLLSLLTLLSLGSPGVPGVATSPGKKQSPSLNGRQKIGGKDSIYQWYFCCVGLITL